MAAVRSLILIDLADTERGSKSSICSAVCVFCRRVVFYQLRPNTAQLSCQFEGKLGHGIALRNIAQDSSCDQVNLAGNSRNIVVFVGQEDFCG